MASKESQGDHLSAPASGFSFWGRSPPSLSSQGKWWRGSRSWDSRAGRSLTGDDRLRWSLVSLQFEGVWKGAAGLNGERLGLSLPLDMGWAYLQERPKQSWSPNTQPCPSRAATWGCIAFQEGFFPVLEESYPAPTPFPTSQVPANGRNPFD